MDDRGLIGTVVCGLTSGLVPWKMLFGSEGLEIRVLLVCGLLKTSVAGF